MARKLRTNLLAAMFSHLLRFGAPLVAYPFLTRVLGTEGFSQFSLIMAAALILSQFIEYGFGLMSVRNISQGADDTPSACGIVLLGRLLTCLVTVALYLGALQFIPISELKSPSAIFATVLLAGAYGFSSSWYFISVERAISLAAQEVVGAVCTLLLILLFVRAPGDAVLAICLFAGPLWVLSAYGHVRAISHLGFSVPPISLFFSSLIKSGHFFVLTATGPVINRLSIIALGVFSSPAQVAYYAAGDRIISAVINASLPLVRILIPRITNLLRDDPDAARRLFLRSSVSVTIVFTVASVLTVLIAPVLVPALFGAEMTGATSIIMLQLCIIPLAVCSRCCGMLALLPLNQEHKYKNITLLTGVIGLISLPFTAMPLGGIGVAASRLAVETCLAVVCICLVVKLRRAWSSPSER